MDAANLFNGFAHTIALWDSTNFELKLGYTGNETMIKQSPIFHNLITGTKKQYSTKTTLECEILEVTPEQIGDLKTRLDYSQDIFIITSKYVFKFNDVYINYAEERPLGNGEFHRIILTAQTEVLNDFEVITNLLSSVADSYDYGSFEVSDPPTGWTEYGGPPIFSRQATFLASGGGTYCGQMILTGISDGIQCDIVCPVELRSVTMTFSAYMAAVSTSESVDMGIKEIRNDGTTVVATHETTKTVTTSTSTRYDYSVTFTPTVLQAKFRVYVQSNDSSGTLKIDNAQLQFGALSTYSQND